MANIVILGSGSQSGFRIDIRALTHITQGFRSAGSSRLYRRHVPSVKVLFCCILHSYDLNLTIIDAIISEPCKTHTGCRVAINRGHHTIGHLLGLQLCYPLTHLLQILLSRRFFTSCNSYFQCSMTRDGIVRYRVHRIRFFPFCLWDINLTGVHLSGVFGINRRLHHRRLTCCEEERTQQSH